MSIDVEVGYRTSTALVEASFLTRYMAEWRTMYLSGDEEVDADEEGELILSVAGALDILWNNFRSEATGDHATFHKLLGCYNLPREAVLPRESDSSRPSLLKGHVSSKFWRGGWGPPHKVFLYTCQLVHTYWEDIGYSAYESCANLPAFIRDALNGERVTDNFGDECKTSLNYRNLGTIFNRVSTSCFTDDRGESKSCNSKYKSDCDGRPWDVYDDSLRFVDGRHYNCWTGVAGDDSCSPVDLACGTKGTTLQWSTFFHPVQLAFNGFVCDDLLFRSRLILDYLRFRLADGDLGDALVYLLTAQHIARYALRIIAGRGRLMIHELGHQLAGAGHCEHDCCFEVDSKAWLCRVRAWLGLPEGENAPNFPDDYNSDDHFLRDACESCSDGTHHAYSCDTIQNGVPGQVASFCSSGCFSKCSEGEEYCTETC